MASVLKKYNNSNGLKKNNEQRTRTEGNLSTLKMESLIEYQATMYTIRSKFTDYIAEQKLEHVNGLYDCNRIVPLNREMLFSDNVLLEVMTFTIPMRKLPPMHMKSTHHHN